MSKYGPLHHGNDGFFNDVEIEKYYEKIISLEDIWIDGPFPANERLGWVNPLLFTETIKSCYEFQKNKKGPFCPREKDLKTEIKYPLTILFVGMGGSIQTGKVLSQLFSGHEDYQVLFLDTTNPSEVSNVRKKIIFDNTRFVFMSKSGSTLETNKIMNFFINESNNDTHMWTVITDEGTGLEKFARNNSFNVLNSHKNIGGRFSSSSHFGLLPSMFLDHKFDSLWLYEEKEKHTLKKKCVFLTYILEQCAKYDGFLSIKIPEEMSELGIWIEQLIAESTGKDGKGIIPLINVKNDHNYPRIIFNNTSIDEFRKIKNTSHDRTELIIDFNRNNIFEDMFIWQMSVAIACKIYGIFPFDEPDVKKSKLNTKKILDKNIDMEKVVMPYSDNDINNIINKNKTNQVLYINLYLNETKEISDSLNKFKEMLISAHDINIVTGFGPRYLHSIGQLQKGGPKNVWSIFFYDDNLINHYSEKNNYKDLSDTFKAQMLGDFNALKELEINAYLFNIDSNKPNPFDNIMGSIKE